ncbi:glycosyltransferase family 2 protein [Catenovulum maritimum]|uniref:Glycosyltransferase 2-like domain-containing protein n=1 Tax=Catenovulum maritimum TaxID=1513271 RepID=A0A0J8JPG4_9ALTE|nr:glycosyltransferase family 2 protein [Catenovulum maritimum]KMT66531.1 hypothetical protein XM47_03065 [Catenovulum maritimum]
MTIKISVIIPTYNCIDYLPFAVSSVIKQNVKDMEIIVVDDGSTDGTQVWLANIIEKYPFIKVIQQHNLGVVTARNNAIAQAKGEYIAFLDADDYWYEDKLGPQLSYMQSHPKVSLSFSNYDHIDMDNQKIIDCFSYWPEFLSKIYRKQDTNYQTLFNASESIIATNVIGTSTVVAKKSALVATNGFDTKLKSASDWDMWIRLSQLGDVALSSRSTTAYLMRPSSITSNRLARLEAMSHIIDKYSILCRISKHAKNIALARLNSAYAEYYREQGKKLIPLIFDLIAIYKHPLFRNFRHLCHDLKRLMLVQSKG